MQLLDPFQIDDRHDADLEIGMLRNIDPVGDDGTVQPFVEQQIRVLRQRAPFGEGAGIGAVQLRLFLVMDVMRSEEHTSELQSPDHLVCRLLLEKKKCKTPKVTYNTSTFTPLSSTFLS